MIHSSTPPTDIQLKKLRVQSIELELIKLDEEEHKEHIDETRTMDWYGGLDDDEREKYDLFLNERIDERNRKRNALKKELKSIECELADYNEEQQSWLRRRQKSKSGYYDIFLSYATPDSHVASELKSELEAIGLVCFMAEKDIEAGADWSEEIRKALYRSDRILLLVTPRSVNRPWLLLETGAAWVLQKPIVPALIHVEPKDLVDPAVRKQARIIETTNQRKQLVKELKLAYRDRE